MPVKHAKAIPQRALPAPSPSRRAHPTTPYRQTGRRAASLYRGGVWGIRDLQSFSIIRGCQPRQNLACRRG